MALQQIPGGPHLWPGNLDDILPEGGTPAMGTATISAAAHLLAMIGRVHWADYAQHSARQIRIGFGAITAGTATFRFSLQDVSLTAGQPARPDGVVDENATIATSGLTQNAVNTSANLSADRVLAEGALIAGVFDFSSFTSGASVAIRGLGTIGASANRALHQALCVLSTDSGATWTAQAFLPTLVLVADDGTLGYIRGGYFLSTINTRTFNSGSTGSGGLNAGDERGLEWVQDVTQKVCGARLHITVSGATSDLDVVLYEGTTAVATVSVDANSTLTNSARTLDVWWAPITLTAGLTYRLILKPTTANNVSLISATLSAAGERAFLHGTAAGGNSRTDAGAFGTLDTTEMPMIALWISHIDDGLSTSGSPKIVRSDGLLEAA